MNKDNTANSSNRQKKVGVVASIAEKVDKSQGLVFTNYQGLTHQQIEGFKKALKAADADFAITKNTLLKRTLADKNLSDADAKLLQQPTATLFMYGDVVDPLKALAKTIKDFKLPTVKFGIIDGRIISEADVMKLSTLPSKDVLRAQTLGMLMSPIQGLHRSLSWNMQSFLMTLSAINDQKGQTT